MAREIADDCRDGPPVGFLGANVSSLLLDELVGIWKLGLIHFTLISTALHFRSDQIVIYSSAKFGTRAGASQALQS